MAHTSAEPAPVVTNFGPCIQDLVVQELLTDGTTLSRALAEDVKERKEFGLKKYGTVLRAFNGRDVMVDLYQEYIDAMQYAKQAMVENEAPVDDRTSRLYITALMAYDCAKANAKAIKAVLLG